MQVKYVSGQPNRARSLGGRSEDRCLTKLIESYCEEIVEHYLSNKTAARAQVTRSRPPPKGVRQMVRPATRPDRFPACQASWAELNIAIWGAGGVHLYFDSGRITTGAARVANLHTFFGFALWGSFLASEYRKTPFLGTA